MSLTSAMSNALSGLSVASRNAQVISTNIGNAQTPGYATRSLELRPMNEAFGGGVMVSGVSRYVDEGLLNDRRLADSGLANAGAKSGFLQSLERLVGTPDQAHSILGQFTRFEASLVTAAAKPEESSRLAAAVSSAKDLADTLVSTSQEIQALRTEAEAEIEQGVKDLNTFLSQIETLNTTIVDANNSGHATASFQDQRRRVLDQLAELVSLRIMPRDRGAIAVFTPSGATLLDPSPADFEFEASNLVAAHMTQANGLLPGLEMNGAPASTGGSQSPIAGGRLASLFEVRDTLAVDAQAQLDAVTRNMIERFQDAGIDSSRAPGSAGLFTDGGAAFDVSNEIGLSGRIAVNSAVDPENGGAVWRLRDGLGAPTPGSVGDAALLQSLSAALGQNDSLASGDLGATERPVHGHISSFLSHFGQQRLALDQDVAFATARQSSLVELELGMGVDTDAEMENLLLVEKAYSANARMMQVIEEMLETLMRI
jgi:flagellar hook-associated protein 1 FlgK